MFWHIVSKLIPLFYFIFLLLVQFSGLNNFVIKFIKDVKQKKIIALQPETASRTIEKRVKL